MPADMFGGRNTQCDSAAAKPARRGCRLRCTRWGAHWCHLANTKEPLVCGGDAALCQHDFDHALVNFAGLVFLWADIRFMRALPSVLPIALFVCCAVLFTTDKYHLSDCLMLLRPARK